MNEKEKLIEKEFEDIDQALRRAAQAAKKLAEQTGIPYVVSKKNEADSLQQHLLNYKE